MKLKGGRRSPVGGEIGGALLFGARDLSRLGLFTVQGASAGYVHHVHEFQEEREWPH